MNCREYSDIVKFSVNWDTKGFGLLTLKGSGMPILFTGPGNYGGILWDTYYSLSNRIINGIVIVGLFENHKRRILDRYRREYIRLRYPLWEYSKNEI